MEITTERLKRCDIVAATGRIDSQTAPQLEEAFHKIIDDGRFRIVFDMSGVDFVSSAGLRAMIDAQKTCKLNNRGQVVLASVPQPIHYTLELTGFVPLFNFFDTAIKAVGSF
ncbi:MAG: STAS domain-containing protein [Anaerolineae bacterium]|jgi:anti-sigma B factor antagonist|nr:STAS domain-containing protein [Anaerolineae bacterium]